MLEKIMNHLEKLQNENQQAHVSFTLYDDFSGSFGHLDWDGEMHYIETFDSLSELESLVNSESS